MLILQSESARVALSGRVRTRRVMHLVVQESVLICMHLDRNMISVLHSYSLSILCIVSIRFHKHVLEFAQLSSFRGLAGGLACSLRAHRARGKVTPMRD
jgi:hypothetical protein